MNKKKPQKSPDDVSFMQIMEYAYQTGGKKALVELIKKKMELDKKRK